ncbi:MAG: protein-disulfide reductase DsbD domain-containing protein [Alphaproteobacteria bacterium]
MKKLFLLLLMALASEAQAQTQQDVLSAAILPGSQMTSGHYMAGLDLTLAPDWKTYWRAPGETGIPPHFDWSGSHNVAAIRFHWPSPRVFTLNGLQSIGYRDELLLPLEVIPADPAKPVALQLQMQLGICKDICMPATLILTQPLGGESDPRIAAALLRGPITASKAGLTRIACHIAPINDGLQVSAQIDLPSQGAPETVVFETADKTVWVAGATTSRTGNILTAAADFVPVTGAPFALERSGVTVTIIGQSHSVEILGCPAP